MEPIGERYRSNNPNTLLSGIPLQNAKNWAATRPLDQHLETSKDIKNEWVVMQNQEDF